jgi:staphylococcal nuclease domain-containing protein 1
MRPVLPSHGTARVKNVLSGDTVVLVGKAASPDSKPPEIVFTFERVVSPRMASKANANTDDPGAFEAREWLRKLVVGKSVAFETRKQGATAGDRVYGLLFLTTPEGQQLNLAVEAVKNGFATPKVFGAPDNDEDVVVGEEQDPVQDYEQQLQAAFSAAKEAAVGIHSAAPLVRTLKTAGEDFETLALVERSQKLCREQKLKCVIEYIFDGSRMRCHVIDEQMAPAGMQYGSFTLFVAGITCPRMGNPRLNPPTVDEPFAVEARQFVELRLLHRELDITLHGTDKSGICAVGTIHHPRGNIAVELLKNGLAKMSDWSVRMLSPMDVPALRIAENSAKRTNIGIWHSYAPPTLLGASQLTGTVVEVLTGDTLLLLPSGHEYDDESKLIKISLASIRAPRVGNERMGRPDEPFSNECKDRLRVLTVGKPATVKVAYERDIPLGEVSSFIEPNHHVCYVCCKIPSLPLALFVTRILKIVNSVSSL